MSHTKPTQEIKGESYRLTYEPATATLVCVGSFRLQGAAYEPMLALMNEAATAGHSVLTLDVRELQFLNSSGINLLSRFVLGLRKQKPCQLRIRGSQRYPWQTLSLYNLARLLPDLLLEIE